MSITDEANSMLMGAGIPSYKFKEVGDKVQGAILSADRQQQSEYLTNKPKFYDDGNPMWQIKIVLQTDLRDPDIEGDDGKRAIFAKGNMLNAIREAIRAGGGKGLNVGDTLAVKFVDKEGPKDNDKKLFKAQYTLAPPKTVTLDDDDF